jgi:hypothetical protein
VSFTRPRRASVVLLSFCALSDAWALYPRGRGRKHEVEDPAAIELRHDTVQVPNIQKRQDTDLHCPDNRWQQFLDSNPDARVKTFCNEWLGIEPVTYVVETTPTMFVYIAHVP